MNISASLRTAAGNRYRRNHDAALLGGQVLQGDCAMAWQGHDGEPALVAVADGVAAGACAALASRFVLERLWAFALDGMPLNRALARALHEALCERGRRQCHGMATTLATLQIAHGQANWLSIGDSRVYLFRDGVLRQLTRDHSLRAEWQDATEDDDPSDLDNSAFDGLASSLTADSAEARFEVCMGGLATVTGDRWMLCTDGVSSAVGHEVLSAMAQTCTDTSDWCAETIRKALSVPDNVDNASVIGLIVG